MSIAERVAGDTNFENEYVEKVIQQIKDHNFKKMKVGKVEYLKPTKAALFALDLRFREVTGRNQLYGMKSRKK